MKKPASSTELLERPAEGAFLVELDADHPGFRDPGYRQRRDAIARAALEHDPATPAPLVEYTARENETWRAILAALAPLHASRVASPLQRLGERLALPFNEIPQLRDLSAMTESATGFRLVPVAGLATPRHFLEELGEGRFPCTQYVRHHARPLYTPEPDVVHELVGHAATLLDDRLCALFRRWGRATSAADDAEVETLTRVFWHALEFGALREDGEVKAVGAGLLSSCGELESFATRAELRDWDIDEMASTPYDPTDYQPVIFVAESWDELLSSLERWPALDA